jgi:hypothetical protein
MLEGARLGMNRLGRLMRAGRGLAVSLRRREGVKDETQAEDQSADDDNQSDAGLEEDIGSVLFRLERENWNRKPESDQSGF